MAQATCSCGRIYEGDDALVGHTVTCSSCHKTAVLQRVGSMASGRTIRCPSCSTTLSVLDHERSVLCGVCGSSVKVPNASGQRPGAPSTNTADDAVNQILELGVLPGGAASREVGVPRRETGGVQNPGPPRSFGRAVAFAVAALVLLAVVMWLAR